VARRPRLFPKGQAGVPSRDRGGASAATGPGPAGVAMIARPQPSQNPGKRRAGRTHPLSHPASMRRSDAFLAWAWSQSEPWCRSVRSGLAQCEATQHFEGGNSWHHRNLPRFFPPPDARRMALLRNSYRGIAA
jgi:hypothetical protein